MPEGERAQPVGANASTDVMVDTSKVSQANTSNMIEIKQIIINKHVLY